MLRTEGLDVAPAVYQGARDAAALQHPHSGVHDVELGDAAEIDPHAALGEERRSGALVELEPAVADLPELSRDLLARRQARITGTEAHIRAKLAQWGGNASGVNVANIDNLGNVHPDTMWWHYTLGNVRSRPFSEIWMDTSDPLMAGLKASPRRVKGRCGACAYFDVCGGNTRVCAQQLTGDPWEEDPACYLTDEEIGLEGSRERLKVTPCSRARAKV